MVKVIEISDTTSGGNISQIKHYEIWETVINSDEMFFIISSDYIQEGYESPKWLNIDVSDQFVFEIEEAIRLINETKTQ